MPSFEDTEMSNIELLNVDIAEMSSLVLMHRQLSEVNTRHPSGVTAMDHRNERNQDHAQGEAPEVGNLLFLHSSRLVELEATLNMRLH